MHPAIDQVIPIAIRRWRRNWWASRHEVAAFTTKLRERTYDLIVDAQGLIKSGVFGRLARGPLAGYHRSSAREGLASLLYRQTYNVPMQCMQ